MRFLADANSPRSTLPLLERSVVADFRNPDKKAGETGWPTNLKDYWLPAPRNTAFLILRSRERTACSKAEYMGCIGCWEVLSNDIDALQAEMAGGGEQAAVVGVDFF
jgi:hypothetical protein